MNPKLLPLLLGVFFCFFLKTEYSSAQNLLDTSTWTVGNGSVSGFSQNGATSENSREYGIDPFGNSSILWKGGNDAASNADGGWNTSYYDIDHTETYRFTVWLKKTNSTNGRSYIGFRANNSGSLRLNDTYNGNPYFWSGDLPQLNKWYLVVGYVHGSNYNSNLSYGGIYDPTTGTKVVNIIDYKFADTATQARHRTYLYFDTNTSDRQFFFAPRMEMVDGNEPPIADLLGLNDIDTNLLNTSTWTVGCGSVSGFSQYGVTPENCREIGRNHIGEEVILWKASPNSGGTQSGGFGSSYKNINHTQDYRLSVWMKKTNSNHGGSYFKLTSYVGGSHHTLKLNGTVQSWPSFWNGDLPQLNRWYLLVGYIHNNNYTSSVNHGKIYDGVTGEVVQSITDYKFKSTATKLQHRAFLYGDTNTNDRQYMHDPRMELIDGSETTLEELLSINPDSKLIFSYDVAGNQKQRFYCEEDGFCSPVAPSSRKIDEKGVKMEEEQGVVVAEQTGIPLPGEEVEEETDFLNVKHTIYPNPTDGRVVIQLSGKDYNLTNSINVYSTNGSLVRRININNPTNQMELDISNLPSGTYFIHMHFTNGTVKTEQIIKN